MRYIQAPRLATTQIAQLRPNFPWEQATPLSALYNAHREWLILISQIPNQAGISLHNAQKNPTVNKTV